MQNFERMPVVEWIPEWTLVTNGLPKDLFPVDVTLQSPEDDRFVNVAFYSPEKGWELMIDKHHFQDCRVIAWRDRPKLYLGYVELEK